MQNKNKLVLLGITSSALILSSCGEKPGANQPNAETKNAVEKSASAPIEGSQRFVFTPDSKISFVGSKKVGDSHTGSFKSFTGHFTLKDGKPVGNDHLVEIDMNSTDSDNPKLTEHLKNADFFDVPNHPKTTFSVTELKETSANQYLVSGNLTLRGTTKNISFPTEVTLNGDTAEIKAKFNLNRMDFGVKYQGAGDKFINEEVLMELDLKAKAQ